MSHPAHAPVVDATPETFHLVRAVCAARGWSDSVAIRVRDRFLLAAIDGEPVGTVTWWEDEPARWMNWMRQWRWARNGIITILVLVFVGVGVSSMMTS